jgi:membrane protein CcdC involved in cytochrome C biogenesis
MSESETVIIKRGEALVRKAQLFMRWGSVLALAAIGAVFFVLFVWSSLYDRRFNDTLYEHLAAAIGVPLATLTALALVLALEQVSGDIELEVWGIKFKGASGPIVMWAICFITLISGIKALW